MEKILHFWRRLSTREQVIVGGGVTLIVLIFLVFYVWQPLEKTRARLRTSLPKLREEAQQLRANVLEVPKLKSAVRPVSPDGLREIVEQTASSLGLQVTQANAEGNNKLNVTLTAVAFDGWVKWLAALQTQKGIRLDSCRIEALPQPGMVKVQAVLAR
jgi:general secretion pathway protein M